MQIKNQSNLREEKEPEKLIDDDYITQLLSNLK